MNSAGNAEISTEMHHKYLESCSCPADEDGVVRKQYVVTDKEYAGYFDKKNHINILDEYKGLLEEVLATVSAQDTRSR